MSKKAKNIRVRPSSSAPSCGRTVIPLIGVRERLILATSLSVHKLNEARQVVKSPSTVDRWAIETTFANMKRDLHLDEFRVRDWVAIERLLWAEATAYTLLAVL